MPHAACLLSAAPRLPSAHRPPESGGVRFSPQLSERKREAIARLGMGTENKVVLRWAVKDIFWPAARPYLQCTDQRFRFLNLHHFGKAGVLLVMCAGAPPPPPLPSTCTTLARYTPHHAATLPRITLQPYIPRIALSHTP